MWTTNSQHLNDISQLGICNKEWIQLNVRFLNVLFFEEFPTNREVTKSRAVIQPTLTDQACFFLCFFCIKCIELFIYLFFPLGFSSETWWPEAPYPAVAFRAGQRRRLSESSWIWQQRAGGSSLQSDDASTKVSGCTSFHKMADVWQRCICHYSGRLKCFHKATSWWLNQCDLTVTEPPSPLIWAEVLSPLCWK